MSNGDDHLDNASAGVLLGALIGGGLGLGACILIFDEPPLFTGDTVLVGALACGTLGFFPSRCQYPPSAVIAWPSTPEYSIHSGDPVLADAHQTAPKKPPRLLLHEYGLPNIPGGLTDEQWQHVSWAFPGAYTRTTGRPRETSIRAVLDGIFYKFANDCSWRNIPEQYGGFRTVHAYFRQWAQDGTLNQVAIRLRIAELQPFYEEYRRLSRYVEARQSRMENELRSTTPKAAVNERQAPLAAAGGLF